MRENLQVVLVPAPAPSKRFARSAPDFDRIVEAKARLRPLRRVGGL